MYANTRLWFGCSLALAFSALSGCTLDKKDDGADAFREAVPQSESVALSGPDSKGSSSTAAAGPSRRTLASAPLPYAKWYGFTREMRDGVNHVTGDVLFGVWKVIQTAPTTVSKDSAIWGPWLGDGLAAARYQFRITRVGLDEYDYVLEGHPKASASDSDFKAVLSGHGFGKLHVKHGQGQFSIDLDVAKSLDPFGHETDSGSVTISHDLPHDFLEDLGALPRTITAAVTPAGEAHYTVESVAKQDFTGSIHVDAHVDIDDAKNTKLEDVLIDSRWAASGAGRADIAVAGGDLPSSIALVDAIECWGTDFQQSYYNDTVGFAPTAGVASACVYASE